MTTIYKLTDEHDQTKNETQWGAGVSHEVTGIGDLCSAGWLHAYTNPLLAAMLNPIHASFVNPHLWLAEGSGNFKNDYGLKVGYSKITTIEQIDLPVITATQRIAFGILCVMKVYKDPEFIKWANSWLDGGDRSSDAAYAAYTYAARAADAADAAAYAARAADAAAYAADAAYAAADAARAARAAADATYAARDAAYAARAAAYADADIDLVALAERAMTY